MIKFFSAIAFAVLTVAFVSCSKDDTTSDVLVSQVSLSSSSMAITIGQSVKLTTKVSPTSVADSTLTWTSSNVAVALVGSDGTVTGLTTGTAKITVTSNDGSNKTATCDVTVATNIVSVTSVTIDPTSGTLVVGEKDTLAAVVAPTNATINTVSWTSSDESVAVVTAAGVVTALKAGSANIIATADGKTATYSLTVNASSNVVSISGEISGTRTFVADSVYLLKGFVYVIDGAVLNINAGTVIKGDKSTMGSLIIEKGGKINATGTKDKPIVFTSNEAVNARTYGDWGGVILCGKAVINTPASGTTPAGDAQVEGGPRSHYGGTDNTDNSGTMTYVRIEFAGYPFQPDKEINGLTFCGVGSGTTIDYIQVSYSGDDSYEWFGGTVNVKHIIAYRGQDDDFDTDFGFSGNVQFALGMRDYRKADVSGSNGFESDNDAKGSTQSPKTSCVFSNVTMIGPWDSTSQSNVTSDFKQAMQIRRNSALSCFNSVVTGWPTGIYIDPTDGTSTLLNMTSGALVIKNVFVVVKDSINFGGKATDTVEVANWFRNTMTGNRTFRGVKNGVKNPNKVLGLHDMFPTNKVDVWKPNFSKLSTEITSGASFTDAKVDVSFFTKVSYIGAISPSDDWTAGWANWNPTVTVY